MKTSVVMRNDFLALKALNRPDLGRSDEPASLIALRREVKSRMPRVDLPEILLEITARTSCMDAFTHLTKRTARAADLTTSLCAVLLAEACNTGPEPFLRQDVPALRRDRLLWVDQNYMRDETLMAANTVLVAAQSRIPACPNLGRRRCRFGRWDALRGAGAHHPCWAESKVFQPRARRHLVQPLIRSRHRTQRNHRARHAP